MEGAHTILLNEEALGRVANDKKILFVLEWLSFLNKTLVKVDKSEMKEYQNKLVEQLMLQINSSPGPGPGPGPPTRILVSRCLATLFSVGDTMLLFETSNQCNDILKNKDDSPSFLPTKLASIACIGQMYQSMGRMMGRAHEETIALLLKTLKSAESQTRCEIFSTLEMIVSGVGAAISSSIYRDMYKAVRYGLSDRVMSVRVSSSGCLKEMVHFAPFLSTSELETVCSLCFRALEGSNYDVRVAVSIVLASLLESSQKPPSLSPSHSRSSNGTVSLQPRPLEEVLSLFASGFLKGGIGFLKSSSATEIIKGSCASRETRLGVTHAYALLIHFMGTIWWENHATLLINHLLELLVHPKSCTSHVEGVFSRRCISYIITSSCCKLSGKSQSQVVKELVKVIVKHGLPVVIDSKGNMIEAGENESNLATQHLLMCALSTIGTLVQSLGTSCSCLLQDPSLAMLDSIISLLTHPSKAVRLSAAWCLRCIAISCPAHLTPLIDRCLESLEGIKTSAQGITGYSSAVAALIGAAHQTPLGIPHQKGKIVFNLAEEMLRSSSQNSVLSLQRTSSGWLMIGSTMTLGPSVVRSLLPRLLLLWKNSFPKSGKDFESEKSRGDAFTWQVTLENRSGALSAMTSLLTHSPSLVTEEVRRRLLVWIESAVSMIFSLNSSLKSFGPQIKAASATTCLRIFEVLLLLQPSLYEASLGSLLKLVVSVFTLSDSASNNTTTSLLRSMSSPDDEVTLGSWIQKTDHRLIEDQFEPNRKSQKSFILPNSVGSGAIEHDSTFIYKVQDPESCGPFPLGVTIIDKSCLLFGHIFKLVHNKHREQMFNHFIDCIKNNKAVRQETIQMNILAAVILSLKSLAETKSSLGPEEVRTPLLNLIYSLLPNGNPLVRVVAAQALGRTGQVVEGKVVSEIAAALFEKLKNSRDVPSRTGYSLAISCLHRQVGSLGSHSYFNTAIGMVLALTHDMTSPVVQGWSLDSMALLAESGPAFRSYVDPALTQSLRLLTSVSIHHYDVHQCIGKLVAALIITVGPELQAETEAIRTTRGYLFLACSLMQAHKDPLVQTNAIQCFQQLHMFAPRHLNLPSILPILCEGLESKHMYLRRACLACLHQVAQIEAKAVYEAALSWSRSYKMSPTSCLRVILQGEHGLPGILFCLLDTESDCITIANIKKTLDGLVQSLAAEDLLPWIVLCKEVLTSVDSNSSLTSPDKEMDGDDDFAFNDDVQFKRKGIVNPNNFGPPKWQTREFATELLRKVIMACSTSPLKMYHFDLSLARQKSPGEDAGGFLVFHVSDLIRMSFMASTSDSDSLRLQGLETLQLVIEKFAKVHEADFPAHLMLEQFQAQVGAALRPAFSSDTPSHVTAKACIVCSTWIGSGVARDLNDLRRVHQLLVSSLAKLERDTSCRQYNESASTLEKLAILKAWAEVYVVAMKQEKETLEKKAKLEDEEDEYLGPQESLLQLVSPELTTLSLNWLCCLKDHALLTLPAEFSSQLPYDGGSFYSSDTIDLARPIYREVWPPILHAVAIWLCSRDFILDSDKISSKEEHFYLLFGICMESLSCPRPRDPLTHVVTALESLKALFTHTFPQSIAEKSHQLMIELCRVLHRILLTRESHACQKLVLEIMQCLVDAQFNGEEKSQDKELDNVSIDKSISFASLEVCLSVLVRQLPQLSPSLTINQSPSKSESPKKLSSESAELVCLSLGIISKLPEMCSCRLFVKMLTPVLFLMTGIFKESCITGQVVLGLADKIVSSFESLCCSKMGRLDHCQPEYEAVLRSTLSMILNESKSGDGLLKVDLIVTLRVVTVFLSKAPSGVARVPSLQFPCINLFTQCTQPFEDEEKQLLCLKSLKIILFETDKSISIPFIHSLAPRVVELLVHSSDMLAASPASVISQKRFDVLMQGLDMMRLLLEKTDSKMDILSLYIPILVSFLVEESDLLRSRSLRSSLHQQVLSRLLVIAPQFKQAFRLLMEQYPSLKKKLEHAIRSQHQNSQSKTTASSITSSSSAFPAAVPTIQLKTDFSNFK